MTTTKKQKQSDRHARGNVQLVVRVPRATREELQRVCRAMKISQTDALTAVVAQFIFAAQQKHPAPPAPAPAGIAPATIGEDDGF